MSFSSFLNAVCLLMLAGWCYHRYPRIRSSPSDSFLKASQTMLWLALLSFLWVSLLVWGLR